MPGHPAGEAARPGLRGRLVGLSTRCAGSQGTGGADDHYSLARRVARPDPCPVVLAVSAEVTGWDACRAAASPGMPRREMATIGRSAVTGASRGGDVSVGRRAMRMRSAVALVIDRVPAGAPAISALCCVVVGVPRLGRVGRSAGCLRSEGWPRDCWTIRLPCDCEPADIIQFRDAPTAPRRNATSYRRARAWMEAHRWRTTRPWAANGSHSVGKSESAGDVAGTLPVPTDGQCLAADPARGGRSRGRR
jgi:hypothetical protein